MGRHRGRHRGRDQETTSSWRSGSGRRAFSAVRAPNRRTASAWVGGWDAAAADGAPVTTVIWTGGDSGGPLFDLGGRLVGIASFTEADGRKCRYATSDALRGAWKDLAPGVPRFCPPRPVARAPPPRGGHGLTPSVRSGLRLSRCLSDDRWAAVGVIVGDGLILTKASELRPKITVVLGGDTPARVRVVATDPARELALPNSKRKIWPRGSLRLRWP